MIKLISAKTVALLTAIVLSASLSGCSNELSSEQGGDSSSRRGVVAPAELVSLQDVTIGPPNVRRMWQFKIEYLAKENALLKEGDLVVRFDGQRLQNDLIGRKSQLEEAIKETEKQSLKDEATKQDLILAVAEAKKNQEIAQRKVEITDASRSEVERLKQQSEFEISAELYLQAKQKLAQHEQAMLVNKEVLNAKIENRQARVRIIQESLEKLEIKAPKKGMVIYQGDWNGNKPAVGETVYMGRTLVSLPSLDKLAVKVEFDESDTAKVAVGQNVKVLLDAHPEKPFAGKISSLGQAYRNKSQNNLKVVFDAWVELDELSMDIMRPGMKAKVELL